MTSPLPDSEIERLKELERKATPAPWAGENCGVKCQSLVVGVIYALDKDGDCGGEPLAGWPVAWDPESGKELTVRDELIFSMEDDAVNAGPNAALLVALRNAAPSLLAEVVLARAERAKLLAIVDLANAYLRSPDNEGEGAALERALRAYRAIAPQGERGTGA